MSAASALGVAKVDAPLESTRLHYVARAGLLSELSRQTYDSLYKALRETILNAVDADATRVDVDLSRVGSHREMVVLDDGVGMSLGEFTAHFMSLGGSTKFGQKNKFGRIGIGSLALLQYSESASVETKRAGSEVMTLATLEHPWALHDAGVRRRQLAELSAGVATDYPYDGDPADHFTRIRLHDVTDAVVEVEGDASSLYRLLDDLRRVLPLTWTDSRIYSALVERSPDLADLLAEHMESWSVPVHVTTSWEREISLTRRSFGDDPSGSEDWAGNIHPMLKTLRVASAGASRNVMVAGYLLNQKRALPSWSGLTARVQNVAVEESTFFDVTSDPGFRKYVTGEVFLLGDVDRERLINIDRSSFNRECADYRVVQRYMATEIIDFKSRSVQQPQRRKVAVRRLLQDHANDLSRITNIVSQIAEDDVAFEHLASRGLPASVNGRIGGDRWSLVDALQGLQADVVEIPGDGRHQYRIEMRANSDRVHVEVRASLSAPTITVRGATYRLLFADGKPTGPPVVIRNRPREIVFNCCHPANTSPGAGHKWHLSLALELAFLLSVEGEPTEFYQRMLEFLSAA